MEAYVTDRNRELARVLYGRLGAGQSVELALLSSQLDVEQMGVVSQLLSSVSGMSFGLEDADSYIDTILSHRDLKSQETIAAMDDRELEGYIASLASKKK